MTANSNNTQNAPKNVADYTIDELNTEYAEAAKKNIAKVDPESLKRMQEISAELVRRDALKPEDLVKDFGEKYKDVNDKRETLKKEIEKLKKDPKKTKELKKKQEEEKTLLTEFFTTNVKEYHGGIKGNIDKNGSYGQKRIDELTAKLQEQDKTIEAQKKEIEDKDSVKNMLENMPGLHDISLESRKLVNVGKKIRDMEEKGANPKDILVYCMSVTKKQILGVRTGIKRKYIKSLRKRKDASIVKDTELEGIKTSLQPDPNSKAKFKEALKKILLSTIEKQQKKYAEEVSKKITG